MTMLDSFNRPGWQQRKPEARKAAIDEIDDQSVLVELVQTDPELDVQAHALARISDSGALDKLAETLPQPLQAQARTQLLKQLLPDAQQLASINDDAILVRIAGVADDPDLITASIGLLESPEIRMDLATRHPVA